MMRRVVQLAGSFVSPSHQVPRLSSCADNYSQTRTKHADVRLSGDCPIRRWSRLAPRSGTGDPGAGWAGTGRLEDVDPEIHSILVREKTRQVASLELIASENYTSRAVQEALGSCAGNKVAEGYPGARYYGGAENVDAVETLCRERALRAFRVDAAHWGVNVQPLAGSPANLAAYTALLRPHDRIMGLDLPDGGHLTHGFMTAQKRVSSTSVFFESMPYKLNPKTGLIDYDRLEEMALLFRPKMIIAGTSAYPRLLDYFRFRQIADRCRAYLLADMAHISGLVAAGLVPSPFEFADVVTTSTYKTLRGPKHGMVFFRRELQRRVDQAVFPGTHGAPHHHTIAALAVALKMAASSEFQRYQEQVLSNARTMATALQGKGYTLVSGGTETHLLLLDLRPDSLDGATVEHACELASISTNKNSVSGDKSATQPGGLRLGSPAMTSRGLKDEDFVRAVEFFDEAVKIAKKAVQVSGSLNLKSFKEVCSTNPEIRADVTRLKKEVQGFCQQFSMPGHKDF